MGVQAGMLTMPEAYGMYTTAGIESPGGHQGWMGGAERSDDDWMSTNLNLANSKALARTMGYAACVTRYFAI